MISNERSWPNRQRPERQPYQSNYPAPPPRPLVQEDALKSGEVRVERKKFVFALKENSRGRLLRITEDIAGRHNSIIIPATGLNEFKKLLEEMIKASDELPQKPLTDAPSVGWGSKGH